MRKLKDKDFNDKFAVVTGGSQGIGKAIAKLFVNMGGSVAIVARTIEILNQTKRKLEKEIQNTGQFVEVLNVDCTSKKVVHQAFEALYKKRGIPDFLFNCVGYAHPGYIEDFEVNDFKRNMEVNYFGVLIPILATLPYFIKARSGHIGAVSSAMGLFGMMGYATYAPSKFAVVGLMEVLRNELSPYNIKCSILYPSDTKTPGFEKENEMKPAECLIMSETGNLYAPEKIADSYLRGVKKGRFNILPGSSKSLYHVHRLMPKLFRKLLDKKY